MVVINTKKIFITILVSALLLAVSALTIFASDFEFSAPVLDNNNIENDYFYFESYDLYNVVNNISYYVGSFKTVYNINGGYDSAVYTLYLSDYGFYFLSVNGANPQSMKSVLDDFIEGSYGNIYQYYYYCNYDGMGTVFCDMSIDSYYINFPYKFKVTDDLNAQFFNYESQYNNVLRSYDLLMQSYTTLNQNYEMLQTNYFNLQSDYNYINNEFELLTNSYNELDTQYREMVGQVSHYETLYNNALVDIESLEDTISKMEIVISQMESIITRLEEELEYSYMSGYTAAIEEINAFESGIYTIFSSPFVLVGELSQIEIFGSSITKIVGIILLFIILSVVLAFLWKVIPFV